MRKPRPKGQDALNRFGYVVYTRESKVDGKPTRWEIARINQAMKIDNWYEAINTKPSNQQYMDVGQYLIGLGEAERQKEIALMKSVLGEGFRTPEDEKALINQFNYAIVGKEQYEDALRRIDIGLNGKDKGKGLAPAISSLFASKLNTIFGKNINELIRKELKNADTDEKIDAAIDRMEKSIVEVFDKSVDQAFEQTLTYKNASGIEDKYGTLKGYEDLYELYKSNPVFKLIFKESIGKVFNIEKIKSVINREKIRNNKKNGKRMTGWSWANRALSIKSRTGPIGGTVNETVNMLRDSVPETVIGKNGVRTARQIISNKLKTDNLLIFQTEASIDTKVLDEMLAEMSNKMDATKNLVEAHKEMKKYWKKHLSKLNEGFVVFKSGKAYGLNNISEYGGFKGTEKFSLGNLKELPKSPKLSDNIDINKFVMVVANTIQGAVLEKEYDNIREWLYIYITEAITSLMFDDWEQIGTVAKGQRANAIHVLTLNDINIPLSVFLIGAGEALIQAVNESKKSTDFIRLTVHRSKVLYPDKDSYELDAKGNPLVGKAWNTQRDDALQNYSITINFYKNFNEAILEKIIEASK